MRCHACPTLLAIACLMLIQECFVLVVCLPNVRPRTLLALHPRVSSASTVRTNHFRVRSTKSLSSMLRNKMNSVAKLRGGGIPFFRRHCEDQAAEMLRQSIHEKSQLVEVAAECETSETIWKERWYRFKQSVSKRLERPRHFLCEALACIPWGFTRNVLLQVLASKFPLATSIFCQTWVAYALGL